MHFHRFAVLLISFLVGYLDGSDDDATLAAVILTQPTSWHAANTKRLRDTILRDIPESKVFDSVSDFGDVSGGWAIWPLLSKLHSRLGGSAVTIRWVLLCEDGTVVKGKKLLDFLQLHDPSKEVFFGHALRDSIATIIHHFAFIGEDVSKFAYPDFAAGVLLSWPLLERIVTGLKEGRKPRDFAIDPKHELAMLIWDAGAGAAMIDRPEFCTTSTSESCITEFTNGDYQRCTLQNVVPVKNDDVVFAVKTFHEFHKSRVVVVKRTWALDARNIEFFSDQEDHYIPTITLGLNNTERGHCSKTIGIINYFVTNHASSKKWLVIADDDTLLGVPRLIQLLNCYDYTQPLLIGERYGYGFDMDGQYGYAYPTGGSGIVFTTAAALILSEKCKCPMPDYPDDMMLGICAKNLDIPLIHSSAMHQARPYDYATDYLKRINPISFHKHWECDPYLVYNQWLSNEQSDDGVQSHSHGSEL